MSPSTKGSGHSDDEGDKSEKNALTKSQVPGISKNPIENPSYDPVDNTDLSLEKPDSVPSNDNIVSKEERKGTSHVRLEDKNPQINSTSSMNDNTSEEGSGFSGNPDLDTSDDDIFSEKKNITKPGEENKSLGQNITSVNTTTATTTKLLNFLDISEKYSKKSRNKSEDTDNLGSQDAKNNSSSHSENSKLSTYSINDRYSPSRQLFASVLGASGRVVTPGRGQYYKTPYLAYNQLNSLQNPLAFQNVFYSDRAKLTNPKTLSQYYRWYQHIKTGWPYKTAYPDRQRPNYAPQGPYSRPLSSWYSNIGPYQRNNVPKQAAYQRPDTSWSNSNTRAYQRNNVPQQANTGKVQYQRTSVPKQAAYLRPGTSWSNSVQYQRANVPKQASNPNSGASWTNTDNVQYQRTSVPKQAAYPGSPWSNTDTTLYQRSNIPQPNMVPNSQGHDPFKVFEDALSNKRQQIYQNYPYYNNKNLDKLASTASNPFLQPNDEENRFYAGEARATMGPPVNAPLKPSQNDTKKHAFNVFQAAIYLADLLKNGKYIPLYHGKYDYK